MSSDFEDQAKFHFREMKFTIRCFSVFLAQLSFCSDGFFAFFPLVFPVLPFLFQIPFPFCGQMLYLSSAPNLPRATSGA